MTDMTGHGLLGDKVVVVSGVGPGLGRSISVRAAQQGARVVLAARTESRLKEVAAEIDAAGGRSLVVPTDITDDDAVEQLVSATVNEFGRVDAVVNNAFALPSMKPLARTDFEQITASVELTVLGTLRVVRAFTGPLADAASKAGSPRATSAIVNINSMVIRHSEPRYGSYKMRSAEVVFRRGREEVRHRRGRGVCADRRTFRPQATTRARRDRRGRGVSRVRRGQRDHRAHPRCELRGIP